MRIIGWRLFFLLHCCFPILLANDFSIGRIITKEEKWTFQNYFLHLQLERGQVDLNSFDIGYGTTKNTGIQFNVPFVLSAKADDVTTRGLGDILLLGQYHFYKKPDTLGIALFGFKFPTSTTSKNIFTRGKGAFGVIGDLGFIHSPYNWYAQTRANILATTKHQGISTGLEIAYSGTIGKKWHYKDKRFFALFFATGLHQEPNKNHGITVANTSADEIYLGPEVAVVKNGTIFACSFGFPVLQKIGESRKTKWFFDAVFNITF